MWGVFPPLLEVSLPADPLFDDIDRPDQSKPRRRSWLGRLFRRGPKDWDPSQPDKKPGSLRWKRIRRVFYVLLAIALLYYPVGMMIMHRIGDDLNFKVEAASGESRAVAMAAGLIDREVNKHRWTPNDPFFMPSAALDNLPNFQLGIIAAISRFSIEMQDKIGRTRGSSSVDPDLDKAAGLLKYPGDRWIFDFETSIWPQSTSEEQYRTARMRLLAYNKRLAGGQAVFERRADNLQTFIDRVNADLGSSSAVIAKRVSENGGEFFDWKSDDIFYFTKGRIYAYYLILRELGEDFRKVIQDKELGPTWNQMLASLREAAELQPLIVRNGKADSMLMPSHLAGQGFYLLRARTQLKEVSDVLLK